MTALSFECAKLLWYRCGEFGMNVCGLGYYAGGGSCGRRGSFRLKTAPTTLRWRGGDNNPAILLTTSSLS